MSTHAIVVMHPVKPTQPGEPTQLDFSSKEIDGLEELVAAIREVFASESTGDVAWRVIQIVHIEDLPLLMEPPPGASGPTIGDSPYDGPSGAS